MNGKIKILSLFLLSSLFLFSCNKEKTGKLAIRFTASVDDKPLTFNEMIYRNASGNLYSIDEVKYFISELVLINKDGEKFHLKRDKDIHYVNHAEGDPSLEWKIEDFFPIGEYRTVSFIFGLSREKNTPNAFVNPPESNMAWPSALGRGYHYMQINGKWSPDEVRELPLNIHTGISVVVSPDSLKSEYHNYFTISISDTKFEIKENKTTEITLDMNINQWFTNPENYDFSDYGTGIMGNDKAQKILQKNGWNVFKIKN